MSGEHLLHAGLEEALGRRAGEPPERGVGNASLEIRDTAQVIWVLGGILCMA